MPIAKLSAALTAVDWAGNVASFLGQSQAKDLAEANLRMAIWAKQLETVDKGNPALCFVREMQIEGQYVATLIALSLYKPAASSMRAMLETALYYTFFRTHLSELETLVRDDDYYISKKYILEYHKKHTPDFSTFQNKLGVVDRLDKWYSKVSAVIHGQIPGAWVEHKSLAEIAPIAATQNLVVDAFKEGEELVHRFFLCTVAQTHWHSFSTTAKQKFLHGLTGEVKTLLDLDAA
ncbi:hypothetical protein AB8A31_23220 [Tardiphaga sp. 804_B3_N1_9]|uniref:hypothetical protein n=1 Tax=Tardiphaga TaxID=1395974 RepID=UPI001586C693|nr:MULTISPECIES: hypothetical protein [Tardiphaga]NUU43932.1 hypothetical protein [Tardiphaga robiniae]UFS74620.1 hypothetical protein LPB73_22340 [Tardiphaga sp. 37S4]